MTYPNECKCGRPLNGKERCGVCEPKRIQRKRTKGWRMPPNTVSVCRPGLYGNPYKVGEDGTAQECVDKFRTAVESGDLLDWISDHFTNSDGSDHWEIEQYLYPLRGKDLACWCKKGDPCHGDVLLELANK